MDAAREDETWSGDEEFYKDENKVGVDEVQNQPWWQEQGDEERQRRNMRSSRTGGPRKRPGARERRRNDRVMAGRSDCREDEVR